MGAVNNNEVMKRPAWEDKPTKRQPSPFFTSPASKYGRLLVKMDYDHHYKWVGRAAASTDCHTGPQTLEQLRFLTESERWKPSKDQLRDKSFHDFWMNRLVETAKPAIDNAPPPAVVRYADYRRANPTGKTSVVEAYARKKLVQNHKDNLKKM